MKARPRHRAPAPPTPAGLRREAQERNRRGGLEHDRTAPARLEQFAVENDIAMLALDANFVAALEVDTRHAIFAELAKHGGKQGAKHRRSAALDHHQLQRADWSGYARQIAF